MNADKCYEELRAFRDRFPRSDFDHALKRLNRERLQNRDRPERVKLSWGKVKALYARQRGVCPICGMDMKLLRDGSLHADHKNPNAEDFNGPENFQLTHSHCNLKKGSDSLAAQTKHQGRTVKDILEGPNMDYAKLGC